MDGNDRGMDAQVDSHRASLALRVLASGSRGNCTVLAHRAPAGRQRFALIDAGLSPRRTRRLLGEAGVSLDMVDDIFLTHLDRDHFHCGWAKALPQRTRIRIHDGHRSRAQRAGFRSDRMHSIEQEDRGRGELCVRSMLAAHDSLGVVAFRFDRGGATLGFATDLGRPFPALSEALAGVDVLAIESNYCPRMQRSSERPEFLKRRIMGGAGHLSNEECAALAREIGPRHHVVLLHLSQQCNRPELASGAHAGAPYQLTVSAQDHPTPWIRVCAGDERRSPALPAQVAASRSGTSPAREQPLLFD